MLRVLHVTAGISRLSAGVSAALMDMVTHASSAEMAPSIVTYTDEYFEVDRQGYGDIPILGMRRRGPAAFGYAPDMLSAMRRLPQIDIVHTHGLWTLHGLYARCFAEERRIPLVISPHGMLEPWALDHSAWKKALVRAFYEERNLQSAACIHAASRQEARNIKRLGFDNPIAVIQFGLKLENYSDDADFDRLNREFPAIKGRRILLFMSRIHPKKGVINLAEVWGRIHGAFPDWCLVIAGPSEIGHEQEVKSAINRTGAEKDTVFTGPIQGERKADLLAAAQLFVLPSYSENFGVVIAEALASACPVITTKETPWDELPERGCGWWIPTGSDALQDSLCKALSHSKAELAEMGALGRQLMGERYTSTRSAQCFSALYNWLDNPGVGKPDTIIDCGKY